MNRFLPYCLIFMFNINCWSQAEFVTKTVQIHASSELSIKGDTNITGFECDFNTIYLDEHRNVTYQKNENTINFSNARLSLKNKGFDCGNRGINKDFHSMLNTKEHPIISLELIKIILSNGEKAIANVIITISGIKKEYSFPINISSTPINRFVGSLKLNIKDFELHPPRKMFGLIEIKEEIEIDFNLVAEL